MTTKKSLGPARFKRAPGSMIPGPAGLSRPALMAAGLLPGLDLDVGSAGAPIGWPAFDLTSERRHLSPAESGGYGLAPAGDRRRRLWGPQASPSPRGALVLSFGPGRREKACQDDARACRAGAPGQDQADTRAKVRADARNLSYPLFGADHQAGLNARPGSVAARVPALLRRATLASPSGQKIRLILTRRPGLAFFFSDGLAPKIKHKIRPKTCLSDAQTQGLRPHPARRLSRAGRRPREKKLGASPKIKRADFDGRSYSSSMARALTCRSSLF